MKKFWVVSTKYDSPSSSMSPTDSKSFEKKRDAYKEAKKMKKDKSWKSSKFNNLLIIKQCSNEKGVEPKVKKTIKTKPRKK